MKKQHGLILLSLFLGSLLLIACGGSDNSLDGTNWQLDQYRDESGNLVSVIGTGGIAILGGVLNVRKRSSSKRRDHE